MAVLCTACADTPGAIPGAWPLFDEVREVTGDSAMVVSGHPLASEVGVELLRAGGNAVDAAVAVGFALAVVLPEAGNIGGGGFMVIRQASGETLALDYRETAPARATRDMYRDPAGGVSEAIRVGHLASGVPGSVAGLAEAQRRFGRLTLARVLAPAIRLAHEGHVLDGHRARSIASAAGRLRRFEASRRTWLPGGAPPDSGTVFTQPDLARTLHAIADSGPRAFYEGWIADSVAAEMERGGGLIGKDDLARYVPIWREPVTITYRGHTIHSMPLSSSGGVTLALILNMLEGWDSLPPPASAEHVHLLAEVMRRAFMDRNEYLADPAFVDVPTARLTSQAYADRRRDDIREAVATPSTAVRPGLQEGTETTHYSVVDADGNAVAVTTTINSGFGSGVTVSGAGFLLNNEMDDFTAAPGEPNIYGLVQGAANAIAPHKRMLSAMSPTIVLDPDGRLLMLLGSPGGPSIITTVAQVISYIVDYGLSLADAVAAPRVHHQGLPDSLRYERRGLQGFTVRRLERMGHHPDERPGYSGDVAAVMRSAGGGWLGVADPRQGGGAVGY